MSVDAEAHIGSPPALPLANFLSYSNIGLINFFYIILYWIQRSDSGYLEYIYYCVRLEKWSKSCTQV